MSIQDDIVQLQYRVRELVQRFIGDAAAESVLFAMQAYITSEDTTSKLRLHITELQKRISELSPPTKQEPPVSYRSEWD
jgi:hypothetical protein